MPVEPKELVLRLEPKAGLPQQSLHFIVEGYGTTPTTKIQLLEKTYLGFIDATGLSSFELPRKIRVLIFETQEEFRTKMAGSLKSSVAGGHTLVTFEQPNLDRILVRNAASMMLEAYTGRRLARDASWIAPGVVGMVVLLSEDQDREFVRQRLRGYLKRYGPVSLDRLTGTKRLTEREEREEEAVPEGERSYLGDVSRRQQISSTSLVLFLRDWGGQFNFAAFLAQLRARRGLDDAVAVTYPGKFRNMRDLYDFWRHEEVGNLRTPAPNQK